MATTWLVAVPASHPCAAVQAALRLKRVPHRRVDLPPPLHKPLLRAAFGQGTVPAVRFPDGERTAGSRPIMRALDARVPQPRLVRGGPEAEAAEAWGDEVFQALVRRLTWGALRRDPAALASYTEGARPPVPPLLTHAAGRAVIAAELMIHGPRDGDPAELRASLDRIDAWIAAGVLGGDGAPSAADLQVASSVRLLLTVDPSFEDRPAARLARRLFPSYPGTVGAPAA